MISACSAHSQQQLIIINTISIRFAFISEVVLNFAHLHSCSLNNIQQKSPGHLSKKKWMTGPSSWKKKVLACSKTSLELNWRSTACWWLSVPLDYYFLTSRWKCCIYITVFSTCHGLPIIFPQLSCRISCSIVPFRSWNILLWESTHHHKKLKLGLYYFAQNSDLCGKPYDSDWSWCG